MQQPEGNLGYMGSLVPECVSRQWQKFLILHIYILTPNCPHVSSSISERETNMTVYVSWFILLLPSVIPVEECSTSSSYFVSTPKQKKN